MKVSAWGRLSNAEHTAVSLTDTVSVSHTMASAQGAGIAFGNGRSYGDICLNPGGTLWLTRGLNKFIAFDASTGLLSCEAGILLKEIQDLFGPRGWLLPVTPGTQLITVGGAIANDIHGKNHHSMGNFGHHVERLTLQRSDGDVIECGPELAPDWFAATVGGMGLTGVITQATLRLRRVPSRYLATETVSYNSLSEFFHIDQDSFADNWEHTVSWIDCLAPKGARGLYSRANFSSVTGEQAEREMHSSTQLNVPLSPPISPVNALTLRAFNSLYYHNGNRRAGKQQQHYQSFMYPLDSIANWNRLYGRRGFYQYQCVVPHADGEAVIAALLAAIKAANSGSLLAVLKTFGDRESMGLMSFPRPGITLALDFPNRGKATMDLFAKLDAIVLEAGGRLYAAKDARMSAQLFAAGYTNIDQFLRFRDPGISSAMSRRLFGT